MTLSLSWTCQRDRVSLLIKFELNKNNFFLNKMIILFIYCADVENCESFRSFSYIYIQIDKKNDEFEFKLDLLEKQSFTPC